jgi:hypothetical protein
LSWLTLVLAYTALVERGRCKPAEAKQRLDEMLRARGLSDLVRGEDIQQWYNQLGAAKGKPAPALREAVKYYRSELSNVHTRAQAEALAAKCLDAVRALGLTRLKLRGSENS